MTDLGAELNALASDVPAAGPRAGQPSVEWDGNRGHLTTGPLTEQPKSWADLIADWGLDPDEVQVVEGSVQIRAWDANVGGGEIKRLRYYKASLERRAPQVDAEDLAELKRALMKRKPVGVKSGTTTSGTRVVLLADWQIGKADGDGVEGTVRRISAGLEDAARQAKGSDRIVLAGMGDIIEQCTGHYPGQQFTVQLDRREQMRVARRLILRAVDLFAPLAPVDVVAVPGNHGENRLNGKAFTRTSDNDDLAVFEQVADIVASSDRYPDVRFGFPPDDDPTTVTLDIGPGIAFNHGHNLDRGATGQQKANTWWKGQMAGHRPAGSCDILVTGHYHHLVVYEGSGRTWFQCPAMDGGSEWWIDKTGDTAPPGMLSFTVGDDYGPRPWGDLSLT